MEAAARAYDQLAYAGGAHTDLNYIPTSAQLDAIGHPVLKIRAWVLAWRCECWWVVCTARNVGSCHSPLR